MSEVKPGLKYTKEHEWALIEGNRAKVGVTDFAQHHLGDIVYVDLPHLWKEVKQYIPPKDEEEKAKFEIEKEKCVLAVVESVKTASDVYAPLSGKVVEINNLLSKNPEKVNSDPYGEGWMAVIEISNPEEEANLLGPEEYEEYLKTLS